MRGLVVVSVLLLVGVACDGRTAAMAGPEAAHRAAAADLSSQSTRPSRARTRIRVTPVRKLVRECDFRLVREVRAGGRYVVPRQRCWWARR